MRLSRPFSILIAGFLMASIHIHADEKLKRAPNYKKETLREADELERELLLEQQERKNGRRAQQQSTPAATPEIPVAPPPKPLGFSQIKNAPHSHQSMRDFGRKRPKKIDRSTASVFDAYLNSNAHNPALNARLPSSQNAFQSPKRTGTAASTDTNRPDPVVSGGGFNTGQGPHPENGGFSSKPMTLESDSPPGPVQNVEAPQDGDAASPAGPLH
jgi:hypothetical protein